MQLKYGILFFLGGKKEKKTISHITK